MTKQKIIRIFERLKAQNPEPRGELKYRSRFELLIAVILSAQATDVSVNKATRILFKHANTAKKMSALSPEQLKGYIKTIGLFNTKANNILKTCKILLSEHGGRVPNDREALTRLPGVGRKTANVILNTAFGEKTIAVDTHIFRISNRIGLVSAKTPLAVEQGLSKVVPEQYKRHAHHWLILHGRYVCTARTPACGNCLIADLCEYENKVEK